MALVINDTTPFANMLFKDRQIGALQASGNDKMRKILRGLKFLGARAENEICRTSFLSTVMSIFSNRHRHIEMSICGIFTF